MRSSFNPAHVYMVALYFFFISSFILPNFGFAQCEGVKATTNFAIPPYAMWHRAQLTDFPAYLEVEVDPGCGPVSYTISYQIWHENGDTVVSIPNLEGMGAIPWCVELPPQVKNGNYTGRYRVTSDFAGDDLFDNDQTFEFVLSSDRFAKEIHGGPLIDLPAYQQTTDQFGYHYVFADIWYQQDIPLSHLHVEVGVANASDLVPGAPGYPAEIIAFLYEWQDVNQNNKVDLAEETLVTGFGQYCLKAGDEGMTLFQFPMVNTDLNEWIELKENTRYILLAQLVGPEGSLVLPRGLYSVVHNYSTTDSLNALQPGGATLSDCTGQLGSCLYANSLFGEQPIESTDTLPVVRLILPQYTVRTNELVKKEDFVTLKANLVANQMELQFNEAVAGQSTDLIIFSMEGRIVFQTKMNALPGEFVTIPIDHLSSGMYGVTLMSGSRIQTEKMMICR